ncbi:hypothetical protein, partial [Rhizobacter sp. Root16D2]|uniref:hypothetical protein n=1 Tax=Rhizobacter sp. Root16D2 TaxID=1736479 RepID=UPI001F218DDC
MVLTIQKGLCIIVGFADDKSTKRPRQLIGFGGRRKRRAEKIKNKLLRLSKKVLQSKAALNETDRTAKQDG